MGCGSLAYDVERIFAAAKNPWQWCGSQLDIDQLLEIGAESNCLEQWRVALSEIEKGFPYWDHTADLLLNSSQYHHQIGLYYKIEKKKPKLALKKT